MTSSAERSWRRLRTALREWKMVGKALVSTRHPILAHIVPTRRCNLSCAYCNEYDHESKPVALPLMLERIDRLRELGTSIVTISGGEPLLHPDLDGIIARIRSRGMIAGLISNGYLMSPKRIRALNEAGLEHLQISIDNVQPDEHSKKSLKVLDKRLQYLAEYAHFKVNVNSVLGAGVRRPADAATVARRAVELGFTSTVGIIHDGRGRLRPLNEQQQLIFQELKTIGKSGYPRINRYFQENLAAGRPNHWYCRAGARYLYICEDGLVHYCSQQRGHPGIPLERYTKRDIEREYRTRKSCAPFCTVTCAHQASMADFWRAAQELEAVRSRKPQPFVILEE